MCASLRVSACVSQDTSGHAEHAHIIGCACMTSTGWFRRHVVGVVCRETRMMHEDVSGADASVHHSECQYVFHKTHEGVH